MEGIGKGIFSFRKKNASFNLGLGTSFIGLFLLTSPAKNFSPVLPKSVGTCYSKVCCETANSFLASMDFHVDPCDDFYRYACGNFVNNAKIPEHREQITNFIILKREILKQLNQSLSSNRRSDSRPLSLLKKTYQSCMNTELIEKVGLSEIANNIKHLGGWPVVDGDSWNEADFDWLNATHKSRIFGYDANILFSIQGRTFTLSNGSVETKLTIRPPSFYPHQRYLKNDTLTKAYLKYARALAEAFGAEKGRAANETLEMLDFEMNLINISSMAKKDQFWERWSISEFKKKYPTIPWSRFLEAHMPTNLTVPENDTIVVNVEYVRNMVSLLAQTSNRTIGNFIMNAVANSLVPFLNNQVRKDKLAFYTLISGETNYAERWEDCVGEINNLLPIAMSSVYIQQHFKREIQPLNEVRDIFRHLKEKYIDLIQQSNILDYESKVKALAKLAAMFTYIGYPKELLNDQVINEYYKELELPNGTFLEVASKIKKFNDYKNKANWQKVLIRPNWKDFAKATLLEPFYRTYYNAIQMPAAILHGVVFNKFRPKYVNYGGFGMLFGHEMSHGFDPSCMKYDKDGNNLPVLSTQSQKDYQKRIECIINQYSNYTVKEVGINVDGNKTVNENFADIVGTKIAYNAYNEWVAEFGEEKKLPGINRSPKQLFWLSIANLWCSKYQPSYLKDMIVDDDEEHSPAEARINLSFRNNREFAMDYECPQGSKMNPIDRCPIF